MGLKSVHKILESISDKPGRLDKEELIQKHENDGLFRKCINYILNPYLRYNIGEIKFKNWMWK